MTFSTIPLFASATLPGPKHSPPASDALVGFYFDQVGRSARVELLGIAEFFWQIILQNVADYTGDLHVRTLSVRMVQGAPGIRHADAGS